MNTINEMPKMIESSKAIKQDFSKERGCLNGDSRRVSNLTNEITYNVQFGISKVGYYTFYGWLKFATKEDAIEYLNEIKATEGIVDGKEYYMLMKQESCVFSEFSSYSVK